MSAGDPSSIDTTLLQIQRTIPIRKVVYRQARLATRRRILDAGAGTGLVSEEIASRTGSEVVALDKVCFENPVKWIHRVTGVIEKMPFKPEAFDAVVFNFVVLWLTDPVAALREASRVLSKDGVLLFLAEPDLTRRCDEPDTGLGRMIAETVKKVGGNPDAGSLLEGWLRKACFLPGIHTVQDEWVNISEPAEVLEEIDFLMKAGTIDRKERARLVSIEREAVLSGKRRVLLPLTFGIANRQL